MIFQLVTAEAPNLNEEIFLSLNESKNCGLKVHCSKVLQIDDEPLINGAAAGEFFEVGIAK